ncbi:MAG: ISNCY family transposase [Gemmobacter sp.]
MQEWDRAEIIGACARGEIAVAIAAQRLQITARQVLRLRKRFVEGGAGAMASRHRGKPSNNQLEDGLAKEALELVLAQYYDFGPTFACEKLRDEHKLILSKETLRQLMIGAGLWTPKGVQRAALHQPRERRPCRGELVQIDGSRHDWFEGRSAACTLLVYIDDATGELLQLYFADTESTTGYFEATRRYIGQHGKPQAFYSDRAAVFRAPLAKSDTCTQFERALGQLGIELICAKTPQAKGRVERANRVLQDRLVKELRLDGIDDIEAANAWCERYLPRYNERFARTPLSELDKHTPAHVNDDLALILAVCELRKLSKQLTLKQRSRMLLLNDTPEARSLIGQPIAIHTYADGRVELRANKQIFGYTSMAVSPPTRLTDTDPKSLHATLDKKQRARPYRVDLPAAIITQGTTAAKKASAQKRV